MQPYLSTADIVINFVRTLVAPFCLPCITPVRKTLTTDVGTNAAEEAPYDSARSVAL